MRMPLLWRVSLFPVTVANGIECGSVFGRTSVYLVKLTDKIGTSESCDAVRIGIFCIVMSVAGSCLRGGYLRPCCTAGPALKNELQLFFLSRILYIKISVGRNIRSLKASAVFGGHYGDCLLPWRGNGIFPEQGNIFVPAAGFRRTAGSTLGVDSTKGRSCPDAVRAVD